MGDWDSVKLGDSVLGQVRDDLDHRGQSRHLCRFRPKSAEPCITKDTFEEDKRDIDQLLEFIEGGDRKEQNKKKKK